MNLKRTTLFLVGILCFLFSKGMNQHDSANLFMESFSFEKTVIDGKFDISLNVYALDCLDWEHSFVVLPDSQQTWFGSFNVLPGPPLPTNLAYGNTVSRSVQVFYQPTLRPYHLQKLKVGLMNDRTQKLVTWEYVYIYFTPYNTVEVWNLEDFEMLKRVWSSSEGTSLQRVYVDQQGLPVSDLSDADYANDSIPKRNVLVSGLAYAVPMHAVPNGNKVNANLFSGTITGQVTADVEDDYGNNISISIWDIRVNLMENGTVIAEGYTDEDGNFSISYTDYSKSWQNIHIYLNVEGENEAGTIRLRRRIGSTRSEDLFVGSEYSHHTDDVGSHDFGTFLVDNHTVKPQLLHWANRSRQLVDSTSTFVLPGSGDRLEIMPSFVGAGQAMFMPGGYQGKLIGTVLLLGAAAGATLAPLVVAGVLAVAILVMTSNHDCIYMGSDYELSENVTYHEFGHYLMWHLQNESWAPLFEASFGHHSSTRNNKSPKLSWNEGFANGFSAIVDAWSAIDDGEFGDNTSGNYETRTLGGSLPEINNKSVDDGTTTLWSAQTVTHGIVSEWSIAAAIYDLWDGPNNLAQNGNATPTASEYNDGGDDLVEMDFQDIIQGLIDHAGTGGFHNSLNDQEQFLLAEIVDFHKYLMLNETNCQARQDITAVMHMNGIRNLHMDLGGVSMPELFYADLLNTDSIYFTRTVEWNTFDSSSSALIDYEVTGTETYDIDVSVNELRGTNDSYNFTTNVDASGTLSDDLLVTGTAPLGAAILYFNNMYNSGWYFAGNHYGEPMGTAISGGHFDVSLCGGMNLTANNGGTIELGSVFGTTSTVTLESGGALTLGGGTWAGSTELDPVYGDHISKGKLKVHDNSTFVVDVGATLNINRGAEIHLVGSNSLLEINGNIVISDSALFTFLGDGSIYFNLPKLTGGAANVTVGSVAHILFKGNDITDHIFTIEESSYFRPNWTDDSLTFAIEDGYGFLGGDAYIDVANGEFTMLNTHLKSSSVGFKGVILNGNSNLIDNIIIDQGNPGIEARAIKTDGIFPLEISNADFNEGKIGVLVDATDLVITNSTFDSLSTYGVSANLSDLSFTDCDFNECGYGVLTVEGGVEMDNCTMTDGSTGLYCSNATSNPLISNVVVTNNVNSGIYFLGGSVTAELTSVQSNSNAWGALGSGTNLEAVCSEFNSNNFSGIWMDGAAVLDMEAYAYNEVRDNWMHSIVFLGARKPLLDYGNNDLTHLTSFYSLQGSLIDEVCIPGVMGNPSYMPNDRITAMKNTWNSSLSAPSASDYDVTDLTIGCAYTVTDGAGGAPFSCGSPLKMAPSAPNENPLFSAGSRFSAGQFQYERLGAVVGRLRQQAPNAQLLADWHEVLTAPIAQADAADRALLVMAYDGLAYAFGQIAREQKINFDPKAADPMVRQMCEALDAQLQLMADAPETWHRDRLAADRAQMAYHQGQTGDALRAFAQEISQAKGPWASYLQQLECAADAKHKLLHNEIDILAYFEAVAACGNKTQETSSGQPAAAPVQELAFSLAPNPSTGLFSLEMRGSASSWSLQVRDLNGRTIFQQEYPGTIQGPVQTEQIDLRHLSGGLYMVRIQAGKQMLSKRLVIQK